MDQNNIEFKIDEALEMDETDFLMVSSVEKEPLKEEFQNLEKTQIKKEQLNFAADIEADELYENPRAIQIARHSKRPNDKWELEWDKKNLYKILLHKRYNGKKIICISIVGNARTGKSTVLNFWLYFFGKMECGEAITFLNGLEENDLFTEFLDGFAWDSAEQTLTNGTWMWSKLFVIGEVAVLLHDCEGGNSARDGNEAKDDSCLDAQYFSICGLASSVLVYNINKMPTKENLESLDRYTKYGRVVNNIKIPFQNLFFLRRDCPDSEAGVDCMESLAIFSKQEKYAAILKNPNVNVNCYKLPAPEKALSDSKVYKQHFLAGKCTIKKVGREFLDHLVRQFNLMLSVNEQNGSIDEKVMKSRMLETGQRYLYTCDEFHRLLKNIFQTFKEIDFTDPDEFPSLWSAKRAKEAALHHIKVAVNNHKRTRSGLQLDLRTINKLFNEHIPVALDVYKMVHWTCSEAKPGKENLLRGKREHFVIEGKAFLAACQVIYNEYLKENANNEIQSWWEYVKGVATGGGIGGTVGLAASAGAPYLKIATLCMLVSNPITAVCGLGAVGAIIGYGIVKRSINNNMLNSPNFMQMFTNEKAEELGMLYACRIETNLAKRKFVIFDDKNKKIKSGNIPNDLKSYFAENEKNVNGK